PAGGGHPRRRRDPSPPPRGRRRGGPPVDGHPHAGVRPPDRGRGRGRPVPRRAPSARRGTGAGTLRGTSEFRELHDRIRTPEPGALEKLRAQAKLTARERIDELCDEGSFVEDGALANATADGLPADGVVPGRARIEGRPVVVVANDPMVKAGSWGARTVEKMVRATEAALAEQVPIFWLVDSAGARITDQVQLFPGRRGAGRIFYNQVRLSGQ